MLFGVAIDSDYVDYAIYRLRATYFIYLLLFKVTHHIISDGNHFYR